jgi:endonuclease YncB( thermonuclease family)
MTAFGHRTALAGLAALAMLAVSAGTAEAVSISGTAEVTKPYRFTLQGDEVFLLGVDSVENGQNCTVSGQTWECWAAALRQLQTILSEGDVTCDGVVEADAPKRIIALCTVNGQDVGRRFVEAGFGIALSEETSRYDAMQAEARAAGRGLWQGSFTTPSVWRHLPTHPRSDRPPFTLGQPVN